MKTLSFGLLFSFLCFAAIGQKQANIWYFGSNAGLNFNSGAPVALTNGAMNTSEGCSSICDANGNLLFYTDGSSVWNRNNVVMPNGTGLSGNSTATQSGLIVKQPGNAKRYYVFTTYTTLNYSVVDMTLDGGLGDLLTPNNTFMMAGTEKLCATKTADGTGVWVMMKETGTNGFNAFLLTNTGVNLTPVHSSDGVAPTSAYGQMKFSPQGNLVAFAQYDPSLEQTIQVSNFNNSTGMVSNSYQIVTTYSQTYGVEFSPSGNLLYGSSNPGHYKVYQFNLNAGSPAAIEASAVEAGSTLSYDVCGLQLGPDGKIYISPTGSGYLDAIPNPDTLGAGCGYSHNDIYLAGKTAELGLPEYVSNIFNTTPLLVTSGFQNISCNSTCNGQAMVNATGGTPPYSYTWQPNNDTTATVSNLCAGAYNVTVTDMGGNTFTDTFTIVAPDTVTANSSASPTICGIDTGTVSVTAGGGDSLFTYLWNTGDTTVSVNNLSAGTYSVTVTDSTGCSASASAVVASSNADSVTVTTDNPRICSNDSTQLCATSGYAIYSWNTGDTSTCITTGYAGDYYVTVTDNNHCTATSNHLSITVYAPLSISISVTGDTLAVYDGTTFQWYLNDTAIAGADSSVYIGRKTGNYTVAISDSNGCSTSSQPVFVTGIKNIDENDAISVYPNPLSGDNWQIKVGNNLLGAQLEILDADGRVVYESKIENPVSQISFNAAKGVYMLRVSSAGSIAVLKLIKL